MNIIIDKNAKQDLKYFAKHDAKKLDRIFLLIEEVRKNPYGGIGKPEKLRYSLAGCWSRRIDREHRLVYKVTKNDIIILACRYHYE